MGRRQLGGWGWELSDRELGQALALLGVVAPVLAGRQGLRGAVPLTRRAAAALLRATIDRAGRSALVWDIGPLGGLDGLRKLLHGQPALPIVAAWNSSPAPATHLELHPARGLDNAFLFDLLDGALADRTPHFPLPEPMGQRRWRWPLRIGFPVGDEWLRDRLYDGPRPLSQSVAPLTEPEVGPSRCDIFLVEAHPGRGLRDIAEMSLAEAALVVVFVDGATREDPLRARAIAARSNAAGVVLVKAADDRQAEWLRTFLRELSHLRPVPEALWQAGDIHAFLAARRMLDARPLGEAVTAIKARLEATEAVEGADRMVMAAPPEPTLREMNLPLVRELPMAAMRDGFTRAAMTFEHESGGASHVAAVARAAEPAMDLLERRQAEDRFIRAGVRIRTRGDWTSVRGGFLAGRRHRIGISIGPPEEGLIVARDAIPREALEDAVGHTLTIVISEQRLLPKPLIGKIRLPAFGATKEVPFDLPVPRGATSVNARISVLHRGRILQTALLQGRVLPMSELQRLESVLDAIGEGIALRPETNLRPGFAGLDDRTRFQAAVVLNHDEAGHAGGTAMGRDNAANLPLDFVGNAVKGLSDVLDMAERDESFDRKLASAKSVNYLRLLALDGVNLYNVVGKAIQAVFPGELQRIQVLSANGNTMLPVELIYDLPGPVKKPKLCENAAEALRTGRCSTEFHKKDVLGHLDVVCPSGFWGISKVIEREATDPTRPTSGFTVTAMPTHEQRSLGGLMPVLFAASDHVNDVHPKELERVSKALETLTNKKVTRVSTWVDWATDVATNRPPVLLLLSHTEFAVPEKASLEIARKGGSEIQAVADITEAFVRLNPDGPGPVVMLLGCTTAVPLDTFQTFTVQFKDMGASLVIGTIAPVLGRHAARTAEALIEALIKVQSDAGGRDGIPVGEALRDVRRQLLGRGILMSMSLAAYGDADWRLPARV